MGSPPATFPALFFEQVENQKEREALRRKEYGIWNSITWREYGQRVRETAAGMLSLGAEPGDFIAILGDNRPEWLFCHLGAMTIGCVTCGIYPTSAPKGINYVLNHSEARILFLQDEEQLDKILEILPETSLKQVVVWDPKGLWGFSHSKIIFFDEFRDQGVSYLKTHPHGVDERMAAIDPEDTAMVIYTSGTTGPPKGALISHKNILAVTESYMSVLPADSSDEVISYLPFSHVMENLSSVFMGIHAGLTVNFVESPDTLAMNLREVSPTLFGSVPRVWEKFASAMEIRMADSTPIKKVFFRLAMAVAKKRVRLKLRSRNSIPLSFIYWPLYWLVLVHLKRHSGLEKIRWALCGAAPAAPELFEFFNGLGIPLVEGYGQTESTGIIAVTRPDNPRLGYVGEPIPGLQVKIAQDGEILVKGPGVFKGYHKEPQLTAETIKDGWLYTGDVGVMENGFLKILDRKKDILITAGGKNITPSHMENKLKFSPYIQDAIVIGDGRKYLVALILIDEDNVTKYAQDNRIPFTTFADLTQNLHIRKLIEGEIAKVNKTLARVETIKKFALLPRRFYEEDGDVTPTKKVKRRFVEKRYDHLIDQLYRG
ncbi:MAG: AMP-binding protein [Deltaproteobacteria bacterium]|uniref:AMP-binding protein n=1 Tax=Candidatus Desulfacyla euxinica TaxID=2841693 RepID=A0A8J6MXR6_9DELT|nr:AMP-binding protein [Candidatus Desulfacyla euxinica]